MWWYYLETRIHCLNFKCICTVKDILFVFFCTLCGNNIFIFNAFKGVGDLLYIRLCFPILQTAIEICCKDLLMPYALAGLSIYSAKHGRLKYVKVSQNVLVRVQTKYTQSFPEISLIKIEHGRLAKYLSSKTEAQTYTKQQFHVWGRCSPVSQL